MCTCCFRRWNPHPTPYLCSSQLVRQVRWKACPQRGTPARSSPCANASKQMEQLHVAHQTSAQQRGVGKAEVCACVLMACTDKCVALGVWYALLKRGQLLAAPEG
jgi:hypothetical protein